MSDKNEEDEDFGMNIFGNDEEEYVEEKKPRFEEIVLNSKKFKIRVVGEHCLWGNYVWNASKCLSERIFEDKSIVENKSCIELGAGAGLPSLVAMKNGAKYSVITDYPDDSLIDNIKVNVENNLSDKEKAKVDVLGYVWNVKTKELQKKCKIKNFEVIILSDLVFNHAQHRDLVESCLQLGIPNSTQVHVLFSHHLPNLSDKNLQFFEFLKEYKFDFKKVGEYKYDVMFPEDAGDIEVRKTVLYYVATFTEESVKYMKNKLKKEKEQHEKELKHNQELMEKELKEKENTKK